MFINKVISYKNSWSICKEKFQAELDELLNALDIYVYQKENERNIFSPSSTRWEKALSEFGWETVRHNRDIGNIGAIKNGLSAMPSFLRPDFVTRWLFHKSAVAVKSGLIDIPILLIPTRQYLARTSESNSVGRFGSIEYIQDELELLSPMAHNYPFLLLGYSDKNDEALEILEIEQDESVQGGNHIIDRFIEFPPEYHQAGLDILSYFGTYLREQYPDQDATVKIEQYGLNVRMIIETKDGQLEIIEKALKEYQLIVSEKEPPEKFTKKDVLILGLQQEIGIFKLRAEQQQNIIGMQNSKIDKLLNIIDNAMSNKQPITIEFKPSISISNSVAVNQNISEALCGISELKELFSSSSQAYVALDELDSSLDSLEKESSKDAVRGSSAMSKFKRILGSFSEEGSSLNEAIEKVEGGIEVLQSLAGKYNKIAEWCCLPTVPSLFTK